MIEKSARRAFWLVELMISGFCAQIVFVGNICLECVDLGWSESNHWLPPSGAPEIVAVAGQNRPVRSQTRRYTSGLPGPNIALSPCNFKNNANLAGNDLPNQHNCSCLIL